MSLDIEDGINLIQTAIEGDNKDKLYQQYCNLVVWMDKDNFISFEEFYKRSITPIKKVTKEEAYKNANKILEKICQS